MTHESLSYEIHGLVGLIKINRPEKLGAFTLPMIDKWASALTTAKEDDAVRAVVLTGTGRGFCTGVDLDEIDAAGASPIAGKRLLTEHVYKVVHAVEDLDKPLICAVNGLAIGAGMDMALMCDIRLAATSARFSEGYIRVGLVPGDGGAYFLPRLIGYGRAADLIFTSREVRGEEAYRLGLLDRFVAEGETMACAREVAAQMATWPPMAIRSSKRELQYNMDLDFQRALINETAGLGFARRSPNDQKEQRASFVEKRKPKFTGT